MKINKYKDTLFIMFVVFYWCVCNIPDLASPGNVANLLCLLSDMIHWVFLDVFKLWVLTFLVIFTCVYS